MVKLSSTRPKVKKYQFLYRKPSHTSVTLSHTAKMKSRLMAILGVERVILFWPTFLNITRWAIWVDYNFFWLLRIFKIWRFLAWTTPYSVIAYWVLARECDQMWWTSLIMNGTTSTKSESHRQDFPEAITQRGTGEKRSLFTSLIWTSATATERVETAVTATITHVHIEQ